MLGEIIACKGIQELVSHPRLTLQTIDVERMEMAHAQGILNLLLDVIDYPGRLSRDGRFLLVVDYEAG